MSPPVRRGVALLVVLGILGVLGVVAVTFVTMARLERHASGKRLNATKALLLARSGMEDVLARLSAGQDPTVPASRYGGEDWNADGVKNLVEPGNEMYDTSALNVDDCPVRHALRPSFFKADAFSNPDLLNVESRLRGYSGVLAGDHAAAGNTYALKVEDESAKINVNGGFLDAVDRDVDGIPDHRDTDIRPNSADPKDTGRGWNFQLARILDILGSQPEVSEANLGRRILQNRPMGGYRSVEQLKALIGAGRDLSPFLTVSSWVDARVVHPNGYAAEIPQPSLADVQQARLPLRLEEGGRSPVNLNAAPRAVLVSLFQGLTGTCWKFPTACVSYDIPASMAGAVADRILTRRASTPFGTWGEFSAFCDALTDPSAPVITGMNLSGLQAQVGGGNLCGADLLKANVDPNTQLNKTLPDQLMWRWIDKSDLTVWSTEGSLGPTGRFQVSSLGRVLDRQGRLLAECACRADVEAFSLLRQTSQKDFVGERGRLQDYLSLADPGYCTTGASAAWLGGGQGLAVTTYPCIPNALPSNAAEFDGALGLASTELLPDNPPTGKILFLHHFDDGWDADLGADTSWKQGPNGDRLQGNAGVSIWPDDATLPPSTLNPEGGHAEKFRAPAFPTLGNLPEDPAAGPDPARHGRRGVVSYWIKSTEEETGVNQPDKTESIDFSCVRIFAAETQAILVGRRDDAWGIMAESAADAEDGAERNCFVQEDFAWRLPGGRWSLVNTLWDFDEPPALDLNLAFSLRRFDAAVTGVQGYIPLSYPSEDLATPDVFFVLGGQDCTTGSQVVRSYTDHVMDEFAILDFGAIEADAWGACETWAATRYQDGRYYKGNDGAFLSAPLLPSGGARVRLLSARWTEYLPRETRMEFSSPHAMPSTGNPRGLDPTLAGSGLALELLGAAGTLSGASLQPLAQGAALHLSLPAFRYRVTFRPTPDWTPDERLNQPVLETPFLDDVTFAWQACSGPRVLAWSGPGW